MKRRAFTVLELLMSMTILLVVLSILASILGASSDLWERGLRRNRLLASGRAALDQIADDLQQAVADTNLLFYVFDDPDHQEVTETFGFRSNALFFHQLSPAPDKKERAVQFVYYGVQTNELSRGVASYDADVKIDPYETVFEISPLLEGVAAFRVLVRTDPLLPDPYNPFEAVFDYESPPVDSPNPLHTLPTLIDIYLELLTPKDSERAAGITDPDARANFIARNALRLTRRVVLSQRETP